jgi:hypothetical protein
MSFRVFLFGSLAFFPLGVCAGPEFAVSFRKDIAPLLQRHCVACRGEAPIRNFTAKP